MTKIILLSPPDFKNAREEVTYYVALLLEARKKANQLENVLQFKGSYRYNRKKVLGHRRAINPFLMAKYYNNIMSKNNSVQFKQSRFIYILYLEERIYITYLLKIQVFCRLRIFILQTHKQITSTFSYFYLILVDKSLTSFEPHPGLYGLTPNMLRYCVTLFLILNAILAFFKSKTSKQNVTISQ